MSTYLERYQSGEYESVWNELVFLGASVRQEPVYADSLAVAREIMRRVRHDIEILVDRLVQRHFIFGYDHRVQPVFHGEYPAEQRREYLEMFAWAHKQPPVFVASRQREEERFENEALSDLTFDEEEPDSVLTEEGNEDSHTMSSFVDEIEQLVGAVPLAMRAWYEEVGGVNFYGYHTEWDQRYRSWYPPILKHTVSSRLMSECDPLMVCPLDKALMMRLRREYKAGELYRLEFAEDRYFKDYCNGSSSPYAFTLPDAAADSLLYCFDFNQPVTFVQYLRTSILRWGGFPGLAQWPTAPIDDVAFLTQGLIPF
ncbi:MAG: hypothetical protein ACRDIV_17365 [Ktedonobacteraceae bacterium]